jgi:LPXTG-site transpeptidase (sortase) family protein
VPGQQLKDNLTLKRKLGWLEIALYAAGAALIAVFVFLRADGDRLRQEGLEQFAQRLSSGAPPGDRAAASLPAELPGELPGDAAAAGVYATPQPDQALWSEARKQRYELARQTSDGPPVAVLSIDHLGIEVPVYDGTSEDILNRGVGRIEGTAGVGQGGNLGIAGHRDSFFRPLKDIEIGDIMKLETVDGTVDYAVSSIEIVEPEDVYVLAPTTDRTITLVTCYPFYYVGHAPKRYIVKATAEHSFGQNLK